MKLRFRHCRSAFASLLLATGGLFVVGCGEFQQLPGSAPGVQAAAGIAAAKPPAGTAGKDDADSAGAGTNQPRTSERQGSKGTNVDEKADKVRKSEREWKKVLSPEEFNVLRKKGTEAPFVNKYDHHFEPGTYVCAGCGAELFESDTKFNSGCGWPAFYAAKAGDRVELHRDLSHFMVRTEVTCARCGGHLGHIFDDAPDQPTGQRYCINSVSLKFVPRDKKAAEGEATAEPAKPAPETK
jgi:peptide-methionine (R)-S-oxide reductase